MKKLAKILLVMIVSIMALFGCDCNKEETAEERKLRLYDCNANGEIDYWEEPFDYGIDAATTDTNRTMVSASSKTLLDINSAEANSKYIYINSTDDYSLLNDAAKVANNVVVMSGEIFGNTDMSIRNKLKNADAIVIKVASATELTRFAELNLTNVAANKYIVVLTDNINFRDSDNKFVAQSIINLNGAALYGNGKTIEGIKYTANADININNDEVGGASGANENYDTPIQKLGDEEGIINPKYSIIANAREVNDLKIYLGLQEILIKPEGGDNRGIYNLIADVAALRNVGVIDNVEVRGRVELAAEVTKNDIGDTIKGSGKTLSNVNLSALYVEEAAEASYKNLEGQNYYTSATKPEDVGSLVFDYDRLINTYATIIHEEGKEDTIEYISTFGDKIVNTKIAHCTISCELQFVEPEANRTSAEHGYYYDRAVKLNVGQLLSASYSTEQKILNNNVSKGLIEISSGADITAGAIAGNLAGNIIAEDCVVQQSTINIISTNTKKSSGAIVNLESDIAVGSLCGVVGLDAEVKNCLATDAVIRVGGALQELSTNLEDGNNVVTNTINDNIYSHVSAGGMAGLVYGTMVNNVAVGEIYVGVSDAEDAQPIKALGLVVTGGVAGSSVNGIFIKNIASIASTQHSNKYAYTGTIVGNAIDGLITSCIVEWKNNIINNNINSNDIVSADSSPAAINTGLGYMQSRAFDRVYNYVANDTSTNITIANIMESFPIMETRFTYQFVKDASDITYDNKYSPVMDNCYVIDQSDVSVKVITTADNGAIEAVENPILIGKYINIGGYFLYHNDLALTSNNSVYNKYLAISVHNSTANDIKSNYFINGSTTKITRLVEKTTDGQDVAKNDFTFYPLVNNDSLAYSYLSSNSFSNLLYNQWKTERGFNGVSGDKEELYMAAETTTSATSSSVNVSNLRLNNIYKGSYYDAKAYPNILSMNVKGMYADFNIDTYTELRWILSKLVDKGLNIYEATDISPIVINVADLLQQDGTYYRDYVMGTGGYETDNNGNYKTEDTLIKSNTTTQQTTNGILLDDNSESGNTATTKSMSSEMIYYYESETNNNKYVFSSDKITSVPSGYVEMPKDDVDYFVNGLTPMEMMVLHYLTKTLGYNGVKVTQTITTNNAAPFTLTKYDVTYNNVNLTLNLKELLEPQESSGSAVATTGQSAEGTSVLAANDSSTYNHNCRYILYGRKDIINTSQANA